MNTVTPLSVLQRQGSNRSYLYQPALCTKVVFILQDAAQPGNVYLLVSNHALKCTELGNSVLYTCIYSQKEN